MIQLDIPGLSIAFTENVYAFGGVTFWAVAAGAGVVTAAEQSLQKSSCWQLLLEQQLLVAKP